MKTKCEQQAHLEELVLLNEAGIGKHIIWRSCDFEKTLQHSFKGGYGYELLTQKYQLNSD